jgi:hypothetical protein
VAPATGAYRQWGKTKREPGAHYHGIERWWGGAVWAGGGKEAAATLGPHREGVSGCKGAMFQTEIGVEWNGGAHGCFILNRGG